MCLFLQTASCSQLHHNGGLTPTTLNQHVRKPAAAAAADAVLGGTLAGGWCSVGCCMDWNILEVCAHGMVWPAQQVPTQDMVCSSKGMTAQQAAMLQQQSAERPRRLCWRSCGRQQHCITGCMFARVYTAGTGCSQQVASFCCAHVHALLLVCCLFGPAACGGVPCWPTLAHLRCLPSTRQSRTTWQQRPKASALQPL